ncbi:SDR family oxidoreductase [bacterium]|nr:SDR family oxidoreductase [bacterium]
MKKQKIIILGSEGMLGHIVYQYLKLTDRYNIFGVGRGESKFVDKKLDVTDFDSLESYILDISPDFIINSVGVLVKASQDNILNAIKLNSYLPHFLSNISRVIKAKTIHISTDCVFSGKSGGYSEGSFRDGDDNYARTKALGEIDNGFDLTIRTSIIGPELKSNGTGLLHWFLNQKDEINGYSSAFWSGVTTLQLAKTIEKLLDSKITGVYNLTTSPNISKYDLLNLFKNIWNQNINIVSNSSYIIDKTLISERDDFKYENKSYKDMLLELKEWMDNNKNIYKHYPL